MSASSTRSRLAIEPEVTVGIPTLGNYGTLGKVLDGYAEQTDTDGTFEVIVVADAADPDPGAVERAIGTRSFPVRLLTGAVPGASANRNQVLREARGRIILFSDNDTIPSERLVAEHLAWHRRWPMDAVGVLGHVRWAKELKVTPFMRWLESGMLFDYANIRGIEAGWGRFVTANVSIKRSLAEKVGEFDENNLPYPYEDTDWAYRASKLGFRLLYNAQAIVDHLKPMDPDIWMRRAALVAAGEYTFCQLHPELDPWYYNMFRWAAETPPVHPAIRRIAPYIPRSIPWLGPRAWRALDRAYKRMLAPSYLEAWDRVRLERHADLGPC